MGNCAGFSGPQRKYRQSHQPKNNPAPLMSRKQPPFKAPISDNKTISTIGKSQSPYQGYRNQLINHILVRDSDGKQNNPLSHSQNNQYQSLREFDLRKSGFGPSVSMYQKQRYDRDSSDELRRIEALLQKSQSNHNSPQNFTRMMLESDSMRDEGKDRSFGHYTDMNSHVTSFSPNNGLILKKKGQLQIIQQLLHEETKTPQYIRGMREQCAQDIPDIPINIKGELPTFVFEPLYAYLKDLQAFQESQQSRQNNKLSIRND